MKKLLLLCIFFGLGIQAIFAVTPTIETEENTPLIIGSDTLYDRFYNLDFINLDNEFVYYSDYNNLGYILQVPIESIGLIVGETYYSDNKNEVFSNKKFFNANSFDTAKYIIQEDYSNLIQGDTSINEEISTDVQPFTLARSFSSFSLLSSLESSDDLILKEDIDYKFQYISGEKVLDLPGKIIHEDTDFLYYRDYSNQTYYKLNKTADSVSGAVKILDGYNYVTKFHDNYMYYEKEADNYKLYRVSLDGTDFVTGGVKVTDLSYENLYDPNAGIMFPLVYHGDYIYYQPSFDNFNLYRINNDGSNLAVNSGTFILDTYSSYPVLFEGDYIYYDQYSEYGSQLMRMDLDGTNPMLIVDEAGGFRFSKGDYIYYDAPYYGGSSNSTLMRVKKTGADTIVDEYGYEYKTGTEVINDVYFSYDEGYNYNYTISNLVEDPNYIYYTDIRNDKKIYKFKKDGSDLGNGPTLVSDISNTKILFLEGDYIYYQGIYNNTIYRIKTDGSEGNDGTKLNDLNFVIPFTSMNYLYNDSEFIYYNYSINYNHSGGSSVNYQKLFKVRKDTTDDNYYTYSRGVAARYENSVSFNEETSNIKINVDATLAEGTDYELYISDTGQSWRFHKIDNSLLDGNNIIDIETMFGKTHTELYYRVELLGNINDQTITPIVNFVEFFKGETTVELTPPNGLTQELKSPYLEKEILDPGKKVGKFQSGSGIIITANKTLLDIPTRLNFEVSSDNYEGGKKNFISEYTTGSVVEATIEFAGTGAYNWKVRAEDENDNFSEWEDFNVGNDFEYFDGFEPYPYGYSFGNAGIGNGLLTGGTKRQIKEWKRVIVPGRKWDIFNNVFPESSFDSEKMKINKFESLGLNKTNPDLFRIGNCVGLAFSALMYKEYPDIFTDYNNNIGGKNIYDNLSVERGRYNKWSKYDYVIETIATFQLFQKSSIFLYYEKKSINELLSNKLKTLKDNPDDKYILTFGGKQSESDKLQKHAVIPYRVEGNKIYVWDNNTPYNFNELNAYSQYIEVGDDGTFTYQAFVDQEGWKYFDELAIISIDDIFSFNKNDQVTFSPNEFKGFNDNDILYSFDGNGDFYVSNELGEKTGYINGSIINDISGSEIITNIGVNFNNNDQDNLFKQIYFPIKENLTVNIISKSAESYDLMIAGGNYYTKLENVETSTGQIDSFIPTRTNLQINFDDNKVGDYNLSIDNFHENSTGSVYIHEIDVETKPQQLSIDWNAVVNNSDEAIVYETDTDNDGEYDTSIYSNSIVTWEELISNNNPENIHTFSSKSIPYNSGQKTAISSYYTIVGNHEGFTWGENIAFTTGGEGNPTVRTSNGGRAGNGFFKGGLNILMDVPPRGESYTGYVDIEGLRLKYTVSKDSLPPLEVGALDFGTRIVNYSGTAYSNRISFPFVPEETEFTLVGEGNPTVQTSNGSRNNTGTVKYGTNIQVEIPEQGQTRIIEFTINGQTGRFTIIRE